MKQIILKLSSLVLLLFFIGAGCQKDEIKYADESITVSNNPGFFLFKTKSDYSDKIWVQITPENELNQIPTLTKDSQNYLIDNKGNVKRTNWYILKNGYVIGPAHEWAAYTDISLKEYLAYNEKNNVNQWSNELIRARIVDKNPYTELYWVGCLDCQIKGFTLGEINDMIKNGTLETVFTKIK
jgi:hypothetical protein